MGFFGKLKILSRLSLGKFIYYNYFSSQVERKGKGYLLPYKNSVIEMAEGLYKITGSDICVSTTGIAGPTGGSKEKPVGLMYSAIHYNNKTQVYKIQLSSDIERVEMKQKFTEEVLKNIYTLIRFV